MTMLPFPPAIVSLLRGKSPNQSLLFDKGFDRYVRHGNTLKPEAGAKQEFFSAFADHYQNRDYTRAFDRRCDALSRLSARHFDARLESRLAIGLGLSHPTETGFLVDRLTGAVYIPGSTVKGLLRGAAERIAPQEQTLHGLVEQQEAIFGNQQAEGKLVCYDAFPVTWPALAVDIMTPHYTDYYMNDEVPGDWESPVPVPFMTVKPGARFRFWFSLRSSDQTGSAGLLDQIGILLGLALDWLAVGAKKSSGYGVMKIENAPVEVVGVPTVWKGVFLARGSKPGLLVATKQGSPPADAPIENLRTMIPDDVYKKLVKGKAVLADVTVEPIGRLFRIVKLEFPDRG